jgi:hypothetical protein
MHERRSFAAAPARSVFCPLGILPARYSARSVFCPLGILPGPISANVYLRRNAGVMISFNTIT